MNFLINSTSHGIGHGTGALPKYIKDAAPVGSVLNPLGNQAAPGSIMETNVEAGILGQSIRDFSEEDAEKLRNEINPPVF